MSKYTPTDTVQREWRALGSVSLDELVRDVIDSIEFGRELYTDDQIPVPRRHMDKWLQTIKLMVARSDDQNKEIQEYKMSKYTSTDSIHCDWKRIGSTGLDPLIEATIFTIENEIRLSTDNQISVHTDLVKRWLWTVKLMLERRNEETLERENKIVHQTESVHSTVVNAVLADLNSFYGSAVTHRVVTVGLASIADWRDTIASLAGENELLRKSLKERDGQPVPSKFTSTPNDMVHPILQSLDFFHSVSIAGHTVTVPRESITDCRDTIISLVNEIESLRVALQERDNQLALSKLEIEALGAQLLDAQQDCVKLNQINNRNGVPMFENQASISTWAARTFGTAGSNADIAARAAEEMSDLQRALEVNDDNPQASEEIADVVIFLFRLADRMGITLMKAVDQKMIINRNSEWVLDGNGQGRRVRDKQVSNMITKTSPFTRCVSYTFTIRNEEYNVLSFNDTQIHIEETRKNGQEDTHFYGELNLTDGRWILDEAAREHLEFYVGDKEAPAIEAFFNEHGSPTKEPIL